MKNGDVVLREESKEKREHHEDEEEEGNVMMNIAHRNITDFVDAPPTHCDTPDKETDLKMKDELTSPPKNDGNWV